MELSIEIKDNLRIKYQELRNNLVLRRKKLEFGSVLCTLLVMSSGDRLKALSESSLDVTSFAEQEKYRIAEQSNLLYRIVIHNKIILIFSAFGIMEIEKELGVIDEAGFLGFIQNKYFDLDESNKKMSASEKTVLLGLITMHCFGANRAIDLDSEETQVVWYQLLNDCIFPFLQSQEIVPKSEKLLAASTGNENPANYLMRRQNNLSKKTAGMFTNPGRNKYFLDLLLNNQIEAVSLLSYLFKLILPERISFELINSLKTFIDFAFHEYVPVIHGKVDADDDEWIRVVNKSLDQVLLS